MPCDIQEEFRASVDRFTLYLLNNRMLNAEDFYENNKDGAVYLLRDAMKKYFVEYEKHFTREFTHPVSGETTNIRKCFRSQAERLAAHIKGGPAYVPFLFEG